MIEISNEELSKVLNLWTGTDEWRVKKIGLYCEDWVQRNIHNRIVNPTTVTKDKEAHALVNFMLKDRKYPDSLNDVFYPSGGDAPEMYIRWVKEWEKFHENKPQDDQPKDIDHTIPVRYDHLISTEELVKRAQERWPDDGWRYDSEHHELIAMSQWFSRDNQTLGVADGNEGQDYLTRRARLLTLINEAQSEKTTPEILDEQPQELVGTKAERFYQFLTIRQDNSAGLWGIVAMELQAPVRGGDDLGWARKNVGGLTEGPSWANKYRTGNDNLGIRAEMKVKVTVEI